MSSALVKSFAVSIAAGIVTALIVKNLQQRGLI